MSIVRIGLGETKGFGEGYQAIFGKKKAAEAKPPARKAKPAARKAKARKK